VRRRSERQLEGSFVNSSGSVERGKKVGKAGHIDLMGLSMMLNWRKKYLETMKRIGMIKR